MAVRGVSKTAYRGSIPRPGAIGAWRNWSTRVPQEHVGTACACSSPAAPTSRIKPQPGLFSYTLATGGNRGTSPRLPGQAGSHAPERVGPYRKESFGAVSI